MKRFLIVGLLLLAGFFSQEALAQEIPSKNRADLSLELVEYKFSEEGIYILTFSVTNRGKEDSPAVELRLNSSLQFLHGRMGRDFDVPSVRRGETIFTKATTPGYAEGPNWIWAGLQDDDEVYDQFYAVLTVESPAASVETVVNHQIFIVIFVVVLGGLCLWFRFPPKR